MNNNALCFETHVCLRICDCVKICVNVNTEIWCKCKYVACKDMVRVRGGFQGNWALFISGVNQSALPCEPDPLTHKWMWMQTYVYVCTHPMRTCTQQHHIILTWIRSTSTARWKKEFFRYPAHFPPQRLFCLPPLIISLLPSLAWWPTSVVASVPSSGHCWMPVHPVIHPLFYFHPPVSGENRRSEAIAWSVMVNDEPVLIYETQW